MQQLKEYLKRGKKKQTINGLYVDIWTALVAYWLWLQKIKVYFKDKFNWVSSFRLWHISHFYIRACSLLCSFRQYT